MRLDITQTELEKLHKIANGRRAMVQIKKKVLLHLLMDYSKMFDALTDDYGVAIRERDPRVKKVTRVMLN